MNIGSNPQQPLQTERREVDPVHDAATGRVAERAIKVSIR